MLHDETIERIRALHRNRCYAMESRKIVDLRLGALLRRARGWRRDLPDNERKAIADAAAALVKDPAGSEYEGLIIASLKSKEPFVKIEKVALNRMERLAETLPVWGTFGEPIRGFGLGSLAVIVAESGMITADPSLPPENGNYPDHSKLWKRMGLAVMDGIRQGGLTSNASKEDWIAHGYSPMRRSRMWNIGDALIKGNRDGLYRTLYLKRKEYELAREPDMQPIMAHRRAQRYMEKRLLKDLWRAWREAIKPMAERPIAALPPAEIRDAA